MESAKVAALTLAKRMVAIPDGNMRAAYLRHTMLAMAPDQVADLFATVMAAAEARDRPQAQLLQSMSLALTHDSCNSLRGAVRGVLNARDQSNLALALERADGEPDEEALRVPDFGTGRVLSLGERKSLARRRDRDLIARVLLDPHPDVIHILMGNPTVTEADVVRLCARRPISSDVLREVFKSARWHMRYQVKVALALNPYTPLDMALQLLPHLTLQDQLRVHRSEELPPALRRACRGAKTQDSTPP